MKKYIYICIVFCISLICYGCVHKENEAENSIGSESIPLTNVQDEEIVFKSAAIEEKTREILGKPDGAITKADVLAITEFEMDAECAAPFEDLQWFENLERVRLHDCKVQSLEGVEKLAALKYLWVRYNGITDIEPVRKLTGLVEFSCAGNPVNDYSPVSGLTNLEELQIGENGFSYTNIDAVAGLTKLTSLYAPWCGIKDISALRNLTELDYLNLFHNEIEDISALEKLDQITYLNLRWNQIVDITPLCALNKLAEIDLQGNRITDIAPLYGLRGLTDINLRDNNISEEELASFFEQKNGETRFIVTQKGRLREDMPEFTFRLTAYLDLTVGDYALQSIEVCEGNTVLQTISIPELTLFGQTRIYDSMEDTLGFALEDVNFDGCLDIRQYDTSNGNYRQEWIYLVWNPDEYQFEYDARLNQISLATFDQEEQLIYGMERGGAGRSITIIQPISILMESRLKSVMWRRKASRWTMTSSMRSALPRLGRRRRRPTKEPGSICTAWSAVRRPAGWRQSWRSMSLTAAGRMRSFGWTRRRSLGGRLRRRAGGRSGRLIERIDT